jgi:two-component system, NtrC family, response regulator AtoC
METPAPRTNLPALLQPGTNLDAFESILGTGAAARSIRAFGRRAAAVDATVLITGETGTGKGVLAHAIHGAGARGRAPFVAINCAGVPESLFESEFFGHVRGAFTGALHTHKGLLEQADRGTVFLDEAGELPLGMQAKLLTVLEDGQVRRVGAERAVKVDVRVIAATGIDLAAAVRAQRFRSDLYHRLKVLSFRLPPLRERKSDLPLLALHYVQAHGQKYARPRARLTDDALELLQAHDWPGNIRELAHTIEAAVVCSESGEIDSTVLQPLMITTRSPATARVLETPSGRYSFLGTAAEEQTSILEALRFCRGNKTLAARRLGMSRNTLLSKLRRIELDHVISQMTRTENTENTSAQTAMEKKLDAVNPERDAAQRTPDSAQMRERQEN